MLFPRKFKYLQFLLPLFVNKKGSIKEIERKMIIKGIGQGIGGKSNLHCRMFFCVLTLYILNFPKSSFSFLYHFNICLTNDVEVLFSMGCSRSQQVKLHLTTYKSKIIFEGHIFKGISVIWK